MLSEERVCNAAQTEEKTFEKTLSKNAVRPGEEVIQFCAQP